jgi:hypothetical protein
VAMWYQAHRYKITLAALPAALFALVFAVAPAARTKPTAQPPSYREQVHSNDGFANRFGDDTPTVKRVRTVSILRDVQMSEPPMTAVAPEATRVVPEATAVVPAATRVVQPTGVPHRARTARPHITRRVSLDICARHGMKRVDYGRRWRCRR